MLRPMKLPFLAGLLCLSAACASSPPKPVEPAPPVAKPKPAPSLAGLWSSRCIDRGAQRSVIVYALTENTWSIDHFVHLDATCSEKFLTVHSEGTYELGEPAGQGAYELKWTILKKSITPHNEAAAKYLSSDGCKLPGFESGKPMDLAKNDCGNLGQESIERCPVEFDLVNVSGDWIAFGLRPAEGDICAPQRRPKVVAAMVLKRK